MSSSTHKGTERAVWRIGTPLVALVSGGLFIVSAANSEGTDLRPGRYTDLSTYVDSEAHRYQRLEDRVNELTAEVDALGKQVPDSTVKRLQQQVDELKDPAGLAPRSGAGVTVTLDDAPDSITDNVDTGDLNDYVVHQQDIQAVVNAMWAGGATAVTIQGQRVISTTGIKCYGSTVQLQGVPYPPPYVISAVGDIDDLITSIDTDRYVKIYREYVADPDYQLGWSLQAESYLEAPPYSGLRDLSYAKPLR